ncbi:MAG: ferrous iron transporter B [Planctomycetes bacterium]|nr:ferrous iron transporter B [Planctomycetota bacterium]MBI3844565.1 ferrous iron transporter B [Planctomycetota bacterium]
MSAAIRDARPVEYPAAVEECIERLDSLLGDSYTISRRAVALLLMQEDPDILAQVREREDAATVAAVQAVLVDVRRSLPRSAGYWIAVARQERASAVARRALALPPEGVVSARERLSRLTMNPWTGIPLLLVILFAFYELVGVFGAGTMVNWLEHGLFGDVLNPHVTRFVEWAIPWPWLQDLFVHENGIWTLGVTYAAAIILPVVATFFIAFSILEDSGYFPRLAMLIDRLFKTIGLNGRAVIPMVLGFGCDTMATMVTRVLETKRERIIATFLLALAVPCSAQLAVTMGVLSAYPMAVVLWATFVLGVFLVIGWLAARVLPGPAASFYMELPPLRVPQIGNVLSKTFSRMQWYFLEIVPLFILVSVLIWIGNLTGVFPLLIKAMTPLVRFLSLPDEMASVMLFGFFRRDYGAAGLYNLSQQGVMSGRQLLVAAVTLTLFIPCVANFLIMKKERGLKATLLMTAVILPLAFLTGFAVNAILVVLRVPL